jgi:bifunctional DNA primase/polymerase-like protein
MQDVHVPNHSNQPQPTKIELLTAAAKACLTEGWAIIPLTPGGKTPLPAWLNEQGKVRRWQNGVHSVYSASFGPAREYVCPKSGKTLKTTPALQAWWDGLESNPAIALELSGLTALDIDEGISDENELLEFLAEFQIPVTRAVRSGRTSSFGVHLLYTGVMDSGSFAIQWRGKTVKGEIKSRDKYVAAEGSFHKSGNQYTRLWNTVMMETPVTIFADILKNHAPAKSTGSTVIPDAAFEGSSVTPEQFETWAEKNGESFTFAGFHEGKQASMYTRDAGCPWIEKHTTTKPNEEADFAVFIPVNGKMSAVCVHESCKSEWTQPSCWKSYRAWLEAKNGAIKMQPTGKVYVGKPPGDFPNGSGVSAAPQEAEGNMSETPKLLTLGDGCLDGRLGEICQKHLSAFPLSYSWPSLVTAASVLYPPTTHPDPATTTLNLSSDPMTNLFTGLVGGIGSGKSQCIEQAASILGLRAGHPQLIEGKFGSAEGMFAFLADLKSPFSKVLITPDELSHLMSKTAIEHSSFASNLTSAFYKRHGLLTVKGGKQIPLNHQISLIAGAVTDEFGDMFGAATLGGLYDRYIFGLFPEGHQPYVYKGDDWKSIPSEDVDPVKVKVNPDVYERLEVWKKEHPGSGRCGEIALRVALISASMSGKKDLTADDLTPALVFADYQYRVRHVLRPNPGENPLAKCVNKILNILREAYPEKTGNRDLERRGHKARVGPRHWDDAIRYLVQDGQIKSELTATAKKEWRMTKEGYDSI